MHKPKLVLASSSPYRKMLLERLGVPFDVANPDIDESPIPEETPQDLVIRLAIEKAKAVASVYTDALIIGSDQVAVHDDQVVGKPLTHKGAISQLQTASGKEITRSRGTMVLNGQERKS